MNSVLCSLCSKTDARSDCYVRIEHEEHPACRPCWEQLLLDPRRVLRSLQQTSTRRFQRPSTS